MSDIDFVSFDGKTTAHVGQGDEAVLLQVERPDAYAGIVLTPDEAQRLGCRLIVAAQFAREAHQRLLEPI